MKYDGGHGYITHANKALEDFLQEHYTISEVGTLRRRKTEILTLMSEDGRGSINRRIGGKQITALRLKS